MFLKHVSLFVDLSCKKMAEDTYLQNKAYIISMYQLIDTYFDILLHINVLIMRVAAWYW